MSTSRHPIALRLERFVGGSGLLLATVMWLPLLDGIFATLVLAGALDSVAGILQVGLLVFGGSATVAVLLAELNGSPRDAIKTVLVVGAPLVVVAGLQAAIAPTMESLLSPVFERFAAVVILAIAAKTASARIGEYLPRPGVIIGLGLVASFDPSGAALTFVSDPMLVVRGIAAAATGVLFALVVAAGSPYLRDAVHVDRFRFGSAVALGFLPLTLLDLPVWEFAPLAVLGFTTLFAFDPDSGPAETTPDSTDENGAMTASQETTHSSAAAPATDGGTVTTPDESDESVDDGSAPIDESSEEPRYPQEREPWL